VDSNPNEGHRADQERQALLERASRHAGASTRTEAQLSRGGRLTTKIAAI
jgi:hypothetical protein